MGVEAIDDVVEEAIGRRHRNDPVLGRTAGPAGNAQLTAWTGLLLLGLAVVELLATGEFQQRSATLGAHLQERLEALVGAGVTTVRVAGLWAGIDIDPAFGTGREIAEKLLARGVLVKDTHGQTIRMAPPLVIRGTEIDWAVEQLKTVLTS